MKQLLVNTPAGAQEIIAVDQGGGYFDPARVLWDERTDGPLPDVTLGAMVRVNGALEVDQALLAALQAKQLEYKKASAKQKLSELATAKLTGGVMINGLMISTTSAARGLLALGKIGNKAQRKIVTESGQRALLTAAQFDAVVLAVDNYGQGIMDRHYDLSAQIDACTTGAEVDAIDINVGWPT